MIPWGRDHGECGLDDSCLPILHHRQQTQGKHSEDNNAIRSIYMCVLYLSNYGKSCADKTNEELLA